MSKVESFYWNKLGNKSFSFESGKFLICLLFQHFRGCIDNIYYTPFLYDKTKGISPENFQQEKYMFLMK